MKNKKDSLGDRMKRYEKTRNFLQPRTYTILRIDGKAFRTFAKGLNKPFDDSLADAMTHAMAAIFNDIQGAKYAYTQSDEISIIITDFDTFQTEPWFNGNVQKIVSVSSSIATRAFNKEWVLQKFKDGNLDIESFRGIKFAEFDSRVFQLPNKDEVINYFIWRQQDAIRNSISGLAQSLYSHKNLHKKNQVEMVKMCANKGNDWDKIATKYKRGIGYYKWIDDIGCEMERHISEPDFEIPIFSEDRKYLNKFIPDNI